MAMATAPARTASPASCPPMSLGSSGTEAATSAACSLRGPTLGRPSEVEPCVDDDGVTVGKRLDGLLAETPPEYGNVGGTVAGGSGSVGDVGLGEVVGCGLDASATRSVAASLKEAARFALAFAVSSTCSPSAARLPTFTTTSSSSAWPSGRLPSLQVLPLATGQMVKRGAPTYWADATRVVTVTLLPAAFRVQTQTAKAALCPAVTREVLENGCTRTHRRAVAGGLDGVGLGVVLLLGVGLGLDVGVCVGEPVGVGLALVLPLADGLGAADWLGVGLDEVLVGLAEGLDGAGLAELALGDGLVASGVLVGVALPLVLVGVALPLVLVGVALPLVLVGVALPLVLVGVAPPLVLVGVALPLVLVGVALPLVLVGVALPVLVGVALPVLVGVALPVLVVFVAALLALVLLAAAFVAGWVAAAGLPAAGTLVAACTAVSLGVGVPADRLLAAAAGSPGVAGERAPTRAPATLAASLVEDLGIVEHAECTIGWPV
jgi:hypothetical protein